MHLAQRSLLIFRGLMKRHGPSGTKKVLWDEEFSGGHWDFIDNTLGDCVYPHLERHARNGSILDLGCGPGNTANELAADKYRTYHGVDISETALIKAGKRSRENGRGDRNSFEQGDFMSYVPPQNFDVILFRESMYHVPVTKAKGMLNRYSKYLNEGGVFIVRMSTSGAKGKIKYRLKAMVNTIDKNFEVLEKRQYGDPGPTVVVFRPRR